MEPSRIYFPLASNASALLKGAGVAGVRRRILAAALLHDEVILEDGLYVAWAGPGGATSMTAHGEQDAEWQTTHARGRATGRRHHMGMRSSTAPADAPLRAVVSTEAEYSWRATYEPFRRELPKSAARWLAFGHVEDDRPAKQIVREWESADRLERYRQQSGSRRASGPRSKRVAEAVLKAGYLDLANAAMAGSAVSLDRRHRLAVETRVRSGEAQALGGHYALELLLPSGFAWEDVPDLRKRPALRDYRAVMREVEAEAMRSSTSASELDERIQREYRDRVAAASARGVPFGGRAGLAAIGFVVGVTAEVVAPGVGGLTAAAGTFAAGEAWARAVQPRWLSVDRRLGGTRNGL